MTTSTPVAPPVSTAQEVVDVWTARGGRNDDLLDAHMYDALVVRFGQPVAFLVWWDACETYDAQHGGA